MRGVDDRLRGGRLGADVVAVEGDVDVADRQLGAGQLAEEGVQAPGENGAAGVDADDRRAASGSGFFSAISWAIRRSVRLRSSCSSTTFSLTLRSFLASRDLVKGRLK